MRILAVVLPALGAAALFSAVVLHIYEDYPAPPPRFLLLGAFVVAALMLGILGSFVARHDVAPRVLSGWASGAGAFLGGVCNALPLLGFSQCHVTPGCHAEWEFFRVFYVPYAFFLGGAAGLLYALPLYAYKNRKSVYPGLALGLAATVVALIALPPFHFRGS
jgi:hypothetical protein